MTIVPDMYHRHPTSGFRMAGNFFKVRYAEDLCPQTATQVHSSPSSHLSKDEYNPLASFLFTYKTRACLQTQPWHTACFETERLRRDSFKAMCCGTKVSLKAVL